jgi:hypothetical protein
MAWRSVVDYVDPQGLGGVLRHHQPVDRGADDGGLVPGRDEHRGPREAGRAVPVVVAPEVPRDQQELPGRGQLGQGRHDDQDDQ